MRTRTIALALLLVTVGWAGCLGDEGPDDPAPEEEGEDAADETEQVTRLDWDLANCRVVVAAIPVDEAPLAERTPEGFELVTPEDFGLPPDLRGEAVLGLEAFRCEQGQGLEEPVEDLAYTTYFAPVEPPSERAFDEARYHFFKWETLVPDEDRRRFLAERGLPVVDGDTDLSGLTETPAGFLVEVSMTLAGETHTIEAVANEPNEEFAEGFVFAEFTEADGGLSTWWTDSEAPGMMQGTGTVSLAEGSWPAEVVGATSTQAWVLASAEVTFFDGWIELP